VRTSGSWRPQLRAYGVDEVTTRASAAPRRRADQGQGGGNRPCGSAWPTWMRCRIEKRPAWPMPRQIRGRNARLWSRRFTRRCCWVPRAIWPRHETLTVRGAESSTAEGRPGRCAPYDRRRGCLNASIISVMKSTGCNMIANSEPKCCVRHAGPCDGGASFFRHPRSGHWQPRRAPAPVKDPNRFIDLRWCNSLCQASPARNIIPTKPSFLSVTKFQCGLCL